MLPSKTDLHLQNLFVNLAVMDGRQSARSYSEATETHLMQRKCSSFVELRDLSTLCACGSLETPEELSQHQWREAHVLPGELLPLLCSAFTAIDLSLMESPWILRVYGRVSSSDTPCCIMYRTYSLFISQTDTRITQSISLKNALF